MVATLALVVAGIVLLVAAGVLAAAETAFTRIDRSRANALAAAEAEDRADDDEPIDERIDSLQRFAQRPLHTLAPMTLLQVLVQLGVLAVGFSLGRRQGSDVAGWVGAGVAAAMAAVVVTLGRGRSVLAPDTSAVRLVPVLRTVAPLGWLTAGVERLARRSSRSIDPDPDVDEQQLLAISRQAEAIEPVEEALIKRVVAFDDTVVGDIMTPRTDLVTLRSGFAVGDALEVASLHGLSRIPVTGIDSEVDDILGAVHVKDLIVAHLDGRTKSDIDRWLRDAPVVPSNQHINNLLEDLRTGRFHMAIVVDEHGGVAGVVTLEDILEELVGEIEDEFDISETPATVLDDGSVRVDGRAERPAIEAALGATLPPGSWRTVAGCFFSQFGSLPEVGDSVQIDGYELEVVRMHGKRIADLLVRANGLSASGEMLDASTSQT